MTARSPPCPVFRFDKARLSGYCFDMGYEVKHTPEFDLWLNRLRDRRAVQAVRRRLFRLELGHFGDHKNLGGGLLELRLFLGPGYRLYCTVKNGRLILLLVGGDKDSQDRDIAYARFLMKKLEEDDGDQNDAL